MGSAGDEVAQTARLGAGAGLELLVVEAGFGPLLGGCGTIRLTGRSFGTRVLVMHLIGGLLVDLPCGVSPLQMSSGWRGSPLKGPSTSAVIQPP